MASNNNKPLPSTSIFKSANGPMMQVKKEALPVDSKLYTSERLASFRMPRDLTLGGLSVRNSVPRPNLVTNKKVYAPNLNAVRNKNVDVKTSRDTSQTTRGRGRGGKTERGRGAATNTRTPRNNVIASSGLFSEGAGDSSTKQLFRSFRSAESSPSASSLRRPMLTTKREKVDPKAERKQIAEIYDLDEDFADETPTPCVSSDNFSPIILQQVKLEDRVKSMEIKGENDTKPSSSSNLTYPYSLDEFFDRTEQQLFLLQMPDALPGHGAEQEPADSAEAQNTSKTETNFCTMANLEEGQIGRLVRYRSGRTKLILGDTQFDIDLGIDPRLLQEVVSVTTNSTERSGNVTDLGKINAKLSAVPDWETMFNNIDGKKS